MIAGVIDCTADEIREHIAYLLGTPVAPLVDLLLRQGYTLKKAEIASVSCLGSLRTEFGELGPFASKALYGLEKFRVCQVLETLRRIRLPDDDSKKALRTIENFIAMDVRGNLRSILRITVLENIGGYIIKDGCKRAVAFYENRRSLEDDRTSFPIYLITNRNHGIPAT